MSQAKKTQLLELPKELKAYIHQHVQELAPFCLPDSNVQVYVEEEKDDETNECHFEVTLVLTGDGVEVKANAESDDVFKAVLSAKQILLDHLQAIQKEMLEELSEDEDVDIEYKKVVH